MGLNEDGSSRKTNLSALGRGERSRVPEPLRKKGRLGEESELEANITGKKKQDISITIQRTNGRYVLACYPFLDYSKKKPSKEKAERKSRCRTRNVIPGGSPVREKSFQKKKKTKKKKKNRHAP